MVHHVLMDPDTRRAAASRTSTAPAAPCARSSGAPRRPVRADVRIDAHPAQLGDPPGPGRPRQLQRAARQVPASPFHRRRRVGRVPEFPERPAAAAAPANRAATSAVPEPAGRRPQEGSSAATATRAVRRARSDFGAPGYGEAYKRAVARPDPHGHDLQGFGECLPIRGQPVADRSRVVDAWGIPALRITSTTADNDRAMLADMGDAAAEMLEAVGGASVSASRTARAAGRHEVGRRAHGHRPEDVRAHAVPADARRRNLFVMDGSEFPSGAGEPDADDDGAGRAIDGPPARSPAPGRVTARRA